MTVSIHHHTPTSVPACCACGHSPQRQNSTFHRSHLIIFNHISPPIYLHVRHLLLRIAQSYNHLHNDHYATSYFLANDRISRAYLTNSAHFTSIHFASSYFTSTHWLHCAQSY